MLARRFAGFKPLTAADAADRLGLPARLAGDMLDHLAAAGIANKVSGENNGSADEPAFTLAGPAAAIQAADVLAAGDRLAVTGGSGTGNEHDLVMPLLTAARRDALAGRSLADLLDAQTPPVSGNAEAASTADTGGLPKSKDGQGAAGKNDSCAISFSSSAPGSILGGRQPTVTNHGSFPSRSASLTSSWSARAESLAANPNASWNRTRTSASSILAAAASNTSSRSIQRCANCSAAMRT